ncbi:UDP-3-O-(3-hydroxymyristoyl)glucosamine N-acyltransferase [Alsobacter soli]|uniref:UDP-3-O-acylglucosamine N-acyltransferase n=1 Tax=Alsobacter soli TaxID=2109933 RepID=A0A2T1HXM4_9HYPH|nr:UDP-3-O-(3-hydroxymyristoyl)glucosamine N-acyltransferase [Alsobacter soli]PSC06453.1 UDP-3-O-(3-hydroxymyristoyl)glucosamine N-acyltransferase [Alsobacter soli]
MTDPVFFKLAAPITLADIAALTGAKLPEGADASLAIEAVSPLDSAGPRDLAFLENPKYVGELETTRALACLVAPKFAARVPANVVPLVVGQPYRACAMVTAKLFPEAMRPGSSFGASGIAPGAFVHPEARLESGVTVDPGAVVGPGAEIGAGSVIGANTVIGPQVRIGRQSSIGPNVTIQNALIGDRVIIHPGARLGQDGFGFAMGPQGHLKVPQVGRVIIQNDVEIGSNTTIDRGANRDTVVGEGTKIDNLVQIAHNVVIGRHCVIVANVGISGSTTLGDFVVLGGAVGTVGHVHIGTGAQIAGASNVATDVPAGARWGGTPAKPMRQWVRELTTLSNLAKRKSSGAPQEDTD